MAPRMWPDDEEVQIAIVVVTKDARALIKVVVELLSAESLDIQTFPRAVRIANHQNPRSLPWMYLSRR